MPKHLNDLEKGQVIAYSKEGQSIRYMARQMGRARATISAFKKKYEQTGELGRKKGSGRPRKTTKRQDRNVIREMLKNRKVTAKEIINEVGLGVSQRTVRRRLNEKGYSSFFQRKRPFINKRNRRKRVKWARDHLNWTDDDWDKVLWSDESPYTFRYQGKVRVWGRKNEKNRPCCTKGTLKFGGGKINVWGCFSSGGIGHIHLVKGILKQRQYRTILRHHMIPSAQRLFGRSRWIFQQDNDPKHTAKSIQRWTRRRRLDVMPWPAQSPDLNPIENLWGILDSRLRNRTCANATELYKTIKRGWRQIPNQTLENLVNSMHKRCKDVIKSRGYPIKY